MEGIKGSSLVGETTTVVAAVITITTTGNTTMATTMVNTTMATTTDNITMDNTTTATTTMVSAVDSQMVDASVTTDYPSETSMGTHMEPVEGRTTRGGPGATRRGGATPAVGICKPRNVSQATPGLIGPVGIMDKMILILGSV